MEAVYIGCPGTLLYSSTKKDLQECSSKSLFINNFAHVRTQLHAYQIYTTASALRNTTSNLKFNK